MPLAKTYNIFSYDTFTIDRANNRVGFRFSVDNEIVFEPTLTLDLSSVKNDTDIAAAVFTLGMSELPSFYKAFCTKKIAVRAGSLTPEQTAFWTTLYTKGLGEFFYQNNIDFRGLINIESSGPTYAPAHAHAKTPTPRVLLPIGGGKDSLVSAEILKEKKIPFTWFALTGAPTLPAHQQTIMRESGTTDLITISGRDPQTYFAKIIELTKAGAPNGHVPISSVYAMSAALVATIHGYTHVAASNERSANVGNTTYLGQEINHQWSKSFEFEQMCHDYIRTYVAPDVYYFSLLRHLYELQIVQKFVAYPQYFPHFISCNRGQSSGTWCGECPKCVFVFTALSAFLPPAEVEKIFGQNLFTKPELLPMFNDQAGWGTMKPFDCVGTFEEMQLALYLAAKQYPKEKTPYILHMLPVAKGETHLHLLTDTNPDHLIPPAFYLTP